MLAEQNKATILQFYQFFDNRQMEQALELLAPNFIAHMAGVSEAMDKEVFRQFGMSFYSAFANGKHTFDEVIVSEDKVITCGTFTGTHLGEFQGLPPTGKQITLSIMHIDRLENNKIVEHWGQGDALGLMQQLGIVFLPNPKLIFGILQNSLSKLLKK